ncbi:MAG: hypothetical protein HKUEN01_16350 [Candidatus Kuenenia stuttgartiensis]|nr:MAG: hypothetical protein HKUEN01_16350 [Candidatus Kuenenia stuttgartiensis]
MVMQRGGGGVQLNPTLTIRGIQKAKVFLFRLFMRFVYGNDIQLFHNFKMLYIVGEKG